MAAGLMFYFVRLVVLPILIIKVYGLHMLNSLLWITSKLFISGKKQMIVRTPEENFVGLDKVGYTFKANYVELPIGGGKALPRVHYVDEGPRDAAETILCLHGEPSWSFLYRRMIPILAAAGYRVIAPDFIGFGKSDKYTYMECYTHEMHTQTLRLLLDYLKVKNVTVVGQDWGGLIGCSVVKDSPETFSRLVVMNTGLPDGILSKPTPAVIASATPVMLWQALVQLLGVWLPIAFMFKMALKNKPSKDVIRGYCAPFPTALYKAGVAQWPLNVPVLPGGAIAADMKITQNFLKKTWNNPVLIMFSDSDPITASWKYIFEKLFPAANKKTIVGAGHFLQEEKGEEIARNIVSFVDGKL